MMNNCSNFNGFFISCGKSCTQSISCEVLFSTLSFSAILVTLQHMVHCKNSMKDDKAVLYFNCVKTS